jgi:uncharacterized protein YjbI with pentapeptide repeats
MKIKSKDFIDVVILVFVAFIALLWIWGVLLSGFFENSTKRNEVLSWTGFFEYPTKRTEELDQKDPKKTVKVTKEFQEGKTFWDMLQLAGIPFVLFFGGTLLNKQEQERAAENRREEILQTYFDRISELLLDHKLSQSYGDSNPARDIAQARTLTVLRSLERDGQRKAAIVIFLHEAELIMKEVTIIKLNEINLGNANLSNATLYDVNLNNTDLTNADLSNTNLIDSTLNETKLNGAKFNGAYLSYANLTRAYLSNANLTRAELIGADLTDANLSNANFRGANLNNANLTNAYLRGAKNLTDIQLDKAKLCNTTLPDGTVSNQNCSE